MSKNKIFDKYASKYDSWFFDNTNLLQSEVNLVAHFLKNPGEVFSIGCGSGLFESILKKDFNITIETGIEPSEGMASIARKRGVNAIVSTAEEADFGVDKYDTILFNGTPSYITDLESVFHKAYKAVRKGGKVVVIDVPKESSYGMMYNLAMSLNTWEHPLLDGVQPLNPYPIEFVKLANWRTTEENINLLRQAGFKDFKFAQTLTKKPVFSNKEVEQVSEGYDSGSYVAICAYKI